MLLTQMELPQQQLQQRQQQPEDISDEVKTRRAFELEKLSGIWQGESSLDTSTITTDWGETELTFTRDDTICRLKGQGTSKWNGQNIAFALVGWVDMATMRFEMFKTHMGKFTNTIVFRGQVGLTPPRLVGRSLKGSAQLERLRDFDKPSPMKTRPRDFSPPQHSFFRENPTQSPKMPLLSSSPPKIREPTKESRQPPKKEQATDTSEDYEYMPFYQHQHTQAEPTPVQTDEVVPDTSLYHNALTVDAFRPSLSDSPQKPKAFRRTATGELEPEFPDGPPGSADPTSPADCPRLSAERSRDFEPCLRLSDAVRKTGDGVVDAAALCGVWTGASIKKTERYPTGEVTEWNDVVMYFNLKQSNSGTIKGRGESVWRQTTIPFLLEGNFDLDRGTLFLRKIHVGKFNNILNYELNGSPDNLLSFTGSTPDGGSLELKQVQQVCDSETQPQKSHSQAPSTTVQFSPPKLHLYGSPVFRQLQPDTQHTSVQQLQTGSCYSILSASAMAPPGRQAAVSSSPSRTEPVKTLLPEDDTEAPKLPKTERRESRLANYSLYLSGMASSDSLSSQQQKALTAYRSSQGITEDEHQAALRSINMLPSDFVRKLHQRTPSDDMCKLCYERQIDCVLLPCGHLTTCGKCSTPLHRCPVCRGGIAETKRVFRA